jgi:hypothetical protein
MVNRQVFIVGAQRCGTTYLYHLLDLHPEIYLARPVSPEPKFFLNDEEFRKGNAHYLNKYFSNVPGGKTLIGEKSTSYLEFDVISERIKSFFPEASVLVILRNPVKRALSNYYFSCKNGLETRTAEEVFLLDKPAPQLSKNISVSPFAYLPRGNYAEYLSPFMKVFGEKMKVLIFEETVGNAAAVAELYRFLQVDPFFQPSTLHEKINAANESMQASTLNEIDNRLASYYQSSIKKLEDLLGRSIPAWQGHNNKELQS